MNKSKIELAKEKVAAEYLNYGTGLNPAELSRIRTGYSTGMQYVIDNPEKFGLVRSTDPADLEKRKAIRETLDQQIKTILAKYQGDVDEANWFNNNMPGVGQTIDYRILPEYPIEATRLEELKAAI